MMSTGGKTVVVLPCSGIGKVFGALARETAYEVVERVRPGVTSLTCLPLLVVEDAEALALVKRNPVITIDGCQKGCAKKSLEAQGAQAARQLQAIDFYKARKDLKPDGIAELDETGRKLAALAAEDIGALVDECLAQESVPC
ncbi:MAG: hypothetical protein HY900_28190 [Deltaproteobacteria bacterium]|nr:hypothetical protein [Deltaproteobacteria bacterium]